MKEITELPFFPPRKADSHKGTYGHLLVVGGSLGMTGAVTLACEAALRTGTGLVTCACPGHINAVLEVKLTEAMTWPLPIDREGCLGEESLRVLSECIERYSALVIGPGIGRHDTTKRFVQSLLEKTALPTVVDADALRVFEGEHRPGRCMILTPHPGEFGRIVGLSSQEIQADRLGHVERFVAQHSGVLVLKGHRTVVATRGHWYVNRTGNPGMATAGSGDVLSGIIGGLLAQGFRLFEAASLGVYLHGRAGDMAARAMPEESVVAGDLIRFLPQAIAERKQRTAQEN